MLYQVNYLIAIKKYIEVKKKKLSKKKKVYRSVLIRKGVTAISNRKI